MTELGDIVRAARQRKAVTIEEASDATRIAPHFLTAIEEEDFGVFPGPAYARGLLRNYAAYLDLTVEEILQTYRKIVPNRVLPIQAATTIGIERLKRRSRRRLTWLLTSAALILLAATAIHRYDTNQAHAGGAPQLPISTSGFSTTTPPIHHLLGDLHRFSPPHRSLAAVAVMPDRTTWVHVWVNGDPAFWGPLGKGQYRRWTGDTVKLVTHHGNELHVWADGTSFPRLTDRAGRTGVEATRRGWSRVA